MRPQGRVDLMPQIRGGAKRALMIMEEDGRPLSTIWVEMFEEDPFKAMQLMIAAHPKEMQMNIDGSITMDTTTMTPDLIREVFNAPDTALPEPSRPDSDAAEVQGGDTLETPAGATVRRLPLQG
jgi:hypothetical protein